jgi:hypothetical protein
VQSNASSSCAEPANFYGWGPAFGSARRNAARAIAGPRHE